MWEFNLDDSSERRYNMIIGRGVITAIRLNLFVLKNVIDKGGGPFESCTITYV